MDKHNSESVFKIDTDSTTGSGWLAENDWIVTNYHVIRDAKTIDAIDSNGMRRKLGKEILIDELNDIAALKFVDPPPPVKPFEIRSEISSLTEKLPISTTGYPFGGPRVTTYGYSNHIIPRSEFYKLLPEKLQEQIASKFSSLPAESKKQAEQFMRNSLLSMEIDAFPGNSGGPVMDEKNKVIGVHYGAAGNLRFAIPADAVQKLIDEPIGNHKFRVNSDFEASHYAQGLKNNFLDQPLQTTALTACTSAGIFMAGRKLSLLSGSLPVYGAFGVIAPLLHNDLNSYLESTNSRDQFKYLAASSADTLSLAGLVCKLAAPLSKAATFTIGIGMLTRAAAEFIPNKYVIKRIERTDGSGAAPFDETKLWD